MKAVVKKEIQVTLVLSEDEAKWLMDFIQNPLCHPDRVLYESPGDHDTRRDLFNAIKESLTG